jgi:hypothetical protein
MILSPSVVHVQLRVLISSVRLQYIHNLSLKQDQIIGWIDVSDSDDTDQEQQLTARNGGRKPEGSNYGNYKQFKCLGINKRLHG